MNKKTIPSKEGQNAQVSPPHMKRRKKDQNMHEIGQGGTALEALARAREIKQLESMRFSLRAAQIVPYRWQIREDKLFWGDSLEGLFGAGFNKELSSGQDYHTLIDPKTMASRMQAILESREVDDGTGVSFSVRYYVCPFGTFDNRRILVEDVGRWYADREGRPYEVYGTLRSLQDIEDQEENPSSEGVRDALTGFVTRSQMTELMADMLVRERQRGSGCAFLLVSISNLGVINDAFGFDLTDEVIATIAKRLREVVRAGDIVCRYSGSKFGVMLARCTQDDMKIAAERFLSIARENVIETESGSVWAMLSIGGVLMPSIADTPDLGMACAEEALSAAMRKTYDCFVSFEPSPEKVSLRVLNARCASEIILSLKEDRFALAYQPIIDAKDGSIAMYEGLLRMYCDENDTIDAIHLIPISEKLGLIRLVDLKVFSLVLEVLRRNPDIVLSINMSGVTATDPRWNRQIIEMLAENHELCQRLIVEITETVVLHDLKDIVRFIAELRTLGCRVAIDDFGAGYTSFRNLKVLNVDLLKIDGSFCENLSQSKDNAYFIRSLIDLAQKFQVKTVAEWVQRKTDAELLRAWGIDYLQGHLFGRAQNLEPWASSQEATHSSLLVTEMPASQMVANLPSPEELFDPSRLEAAKQALSSLKGGKKAKQ